MLVNVWHAALLRFAAPLIWAAGCMQEVGVCGGGLELNISVGCQSRPQGLLGYPASWPEFFCPPLREVASMISLAQLLPACCPAGGVPGACASRPLQQRCQVCDESSWSQRGGGALGQRDAGTASGSIQHSRKRPGGALLPTPEAHRQRLRTEAVHCQRRHRHDGDAARASA